MSRLVIYGRIVDRPCLLDGVPILLAIINEVVLHSPLKLHWHRALGVSAAMLSQEELSEPNRSRNVSLQTEPDEIESIEGRECRRSFSLFSVHKLVPHHHREGVSHKRHFDVIRHLGPCAVGSGLLILLVHDLHSLVYLLPHRCGLTTFPFLVAADKLLFF